MIMEKQSRTTNSLINIITAVSGQGIGIIVSFVARIIFIRQLGEVYLGINSLYTNIVGLLSLAELGVGTAINYSLYKPLAENDIPAIKSLMALYRKVYTVIGFIILGIGIFLLPFLDMFMKASETSEIPHKHLIFFLFVLNSSVSYFYSFKRALVISDQKRYLATLYRYIFFVLMNVLQIIFLILTKDFIIFLLIALFSTVLENILISRKADQLYPFLKEKDIEKVSKETTDSIKMNTVALLFHKVGSSVVNSTDNILIAQIIGIVAVGVYSNYQLIINALNIVIAQFFMALTASIGNLGATENVEKSESIFYKIFFLNFWIVCIISVSIFSCIDLLIGSWFGNHLILDKLVLATIVINFYIYQIRRTVMTYRDAYGLFWNDRYKALAEAILNIVISIYLGFKLGLVGIFLGTIISTTITSLWIEPYILFKYGLKHSSVTYFKRLAKYSVITLVASLVCSYLVTLLHFNGFFGFIQGVVLSVVVVSSVISLLFWKTEEFQYFKKLLLKFQNMILKYLKTSRS